MRKLIRWIFVAVAIYVALLAVGRLGESRRGLGVLAVGAVLLLIGAAVWWLAARGQRGRGSGRDPQDIGIAGQAGHEHMRP